MIIPLTCYVATAFGPHITHRHTHTHLFEFQTKNNEHHAKPRCYLHKIVQTRQFRNCSPLECAWPPPTSNDNDDPLQSENAAKTDGMRTTDAWRTICELHTDPTENAHIQKRTLQNYDVSNPTSKSYTWGRTRHMQRRTWRRKCKYAPTRTEQRCLDARNTTQFEHTKIAAESWPDPRFSDQIPWLRDFMKNQYFRKVFRHDTWPWCAWIFVTMTFSTVYGVQIRKPYVSKKVLTDA